LRDNQNHARCDNQASLPAVSVVQRKLHPGIMMSGYVGQNPGQRSMHCRELFSHKP
jgi:hypothetical protein